MNDLNKVILQIAGGDMKEPTLEEKLQKDYDDEVKWLIEKYEADPEMTMEAIYEMMGNLNPAEAKAIHAYVIKCDAIGLGMVIIREVGNYIRECAESEARGE